MKKKQSQKELFTVKETPARIIRWNWGAFFFGWIWGIFNNVWISLLTLIPIVNIVMPFVLGVKGNQWAWENSDITDVDLFLKKQRKWNIAAGVVAIIILLLLCAFIAVAVIETNKQEAKVLSNLNHNNEVVALLGSPIKAESYISSGYDSQDLRNGKVGALSSYEFDAKGSNASAHIIELWLEYENKESLVYLELTPKNGEKRVLVAPSDNPLTFPIVEELTNKLDEKE